MTYVRNGRRRPVACGVDIGSTNTKVVALSPDGAMISHTAQPTPRDAQGLSIDVPAMIAGVNAMVTRVCGDSHEVHTISVAGIGEDGVLVDSELRPLAPPLAWFDPRRQGIFAALRPDLHHDELFDAGTDPTRGFVGWMWSKTLPGYEKAVSWVAVADLPSVIWTGRLFLSDTLASRTGAWQSTGRSWASDRVELTLGSADLLPPVAAAGHIVGDLVSPTLLDSGVVADDAIVVAGGHDHPIGGWGVHQLVPWVILDSMGTAEVAVAQTTRAQTSRQVAVDIAPGIRSAGTTVLRVEELSRNVSWAAQDPDVAQRIHRILTGSIAPLPVLNEGFFIPGERGGGRPTYGLHAPRDPLARASAVLGALALVGRDAVSALQDNVTSQREVRLAGGWSRYPGWLDIKAQINGFPTVTIAEPEVTAVGAALLAATARGWSPDPATALSGAVTPS